MAVVPLQRISGSLKQGEIVTVLWNNRMECSPWFLLSGKKEALVFLEIILLPATYKVIQILYAGKTC